MLRLAAAGALWPMVVRRARAQTFPARPLRLVVGFPAGGPNDILARLMAGWLGQRLGEPVAVDNVPGEAGNRATAMVVHAAPDGHTLLLVGPANAISASLPDKLDFVFLRDIVPVAGIIREPLVLLVNPDVPATSVAALIAYAKAKPSRLKMASTGAWSAPHVAGEQFKMRTGLAIENMQYAGGGPALKALAAGEAQLVFEPMSAATPLVRGRTLRALAVTTVARAPALPDLPTVGDTVAGYDASAVTGIGVPRGTPIDVIERLNVAINAAFADRAMRARLTDTGGDLLPGTPAEFGRLIAAETEKWGKVVRFARGVK